MNFNLAQLNDILYCTRTVLKNKSLNEDYAKQLSKLAEDVYDEIDRLVVNLDSKPNVKPSMQEQACTKSYRSFLEAARSLESLYDKSLRIRLQPNSRGEFYRGFEYVDVDGDRVEITVRYGRKTALVIVNGSTVSTDMTMKNFATMLCQQLREFSKMPKYVRCLSPYGGAEIGKTYDTSDNELARKLFTLSWRKVLMTFNNLGAGCFEAVRSGQRVI